MIHKHRRYRVVEVPSATELATKLSEYTWCGCNGFSIGDLVFLNDSFSADGAQEYAVFRGSRQIESLTASWMKPAELEGAIRRLLETHDDTKPFESNFTPRTDHPEGTCVYCA